MPPKDLGQVGEKQCPRNIYICMRLQMFCRPVASNFLNMELDELSNLAMASKLF